MARALASSAHSVAGTALVGVLSYCRTIGVPTAGVLAEAGLDERTVAGTDTRVSEAAYNRVWELASAASGDPDFGLHFAERMTIDAFDVVGHLVLRSATFGEGLAKVVAYSRILHDAGRVESEVHGASVSVFPGCRGLVLAPPRHVAELSAAAVLVLGRLATGASLVATAVRFRHPAPKRRAEHLRIFGVVPEFSARETEVVLPASVLALPTRESTPALVTYLDAYARDALAKLPKDDDVASSVEREITAAMGRGDGPTMDAVARRLGTSGRSLQRRLGQLETTFQEIVDSVRRRFAERYLADERLAVSEVAYLVGFADPSNFHRAFRRWTGMTPTEYRARSAGVESQGTTS